MPKLESKPHHQPYAGLHEVAFILSRSKAWIYVKRDNDPTFPEPVAQLHMGPIWNTADIIAYGDKL